MAAKGVFKKEIDWERVKYYIMSGASQVKIASAFFIDRDTLRARVKLEFGQEYSAFSAGLLSEGDMLLEAAIFQKALKSSSPGNTQMLMYLSKVRLGWREPELLSSTPPLQQDIDKDHIIMQLSDRLAKAEANANKP